MSKKSLGELYRDHRSKELAGSWWGDNLHPWQDLLPMQQAHWQRMAELRQADSYRFGLLFRWDSFWIGAHYSKENKRLCINLVPCVTIWLTFPGGNTP